MKTFATVTHFVCSVNLRKAATPNGINIEHSKSAVNSHPWGLVFTFTSPISLSLRVLF